MSKHTGESEEEYLERVLILAEYSESTDAITLATEVRRLRRELEGVVEYEYAIQSLHTEHPTRRVIGRILAYGEEPYWGTIEELTEHLDTLRFSYPKRKFKLVRRRKPGRIEDV